MRMRCRKIAIAIASACGAVTSPALAVDGTGTLTVTPLNNWKAVEIITGGDVVSGYALPGTFDGMGAWLSAPNELRIELNHETNDASISEINLNLTNFKIAIDNTINNRAIGTTYVTSAQQAYTQWSANLGSSWTATTTNTSTSFNRFCSGQYYKPSTFGVANRGFVDNIYITGEEATNGRMMAVDLNNHQMYQLSNAVVASPGGNGGFPADSWENAALIDTGETAHVALLLSPDIGSGSGASMKLYIGEKGKNAAGQSDTTSFLARNGLAYGSYYYLKDSLPAIGAAPTSGVLSVSSTGALTATKFEDVDTNPNNGTQAVVGNQNFGVYTFGFTLNFTSGTLDTATSGFAITKIVEPTAGNNFLGDTDNVDWTKSVTINGTNYSNGLILVNEDNADGEVWMMAADGTNRTLIANTKNISALTTANETTGIIDISELLGYLPGSIILTNTQGGTSLQSSMSVLISPYATLAPEPASLAMLSGVAPLLLLRRRRRPTPPDSIL